jgi:hypothetical protein
VQRFGGGFQAFLVARARKFLRRSFGKGHPVGGKPKHDRPGIPVFPPGAIAESGLSRISVIWSPPTVALGTFVRVLPDVIGITDAPPTASFIYHPKVDLRPILRRAFDRFPLAHFCPCIEWVESG